MARNRIKNAPPTLKKRTDSSLITQTREYRLITPLYGGSAKPGEVDVEMPIRGTEIRGHLRFWWRATRGAHFGSDIKAMKQAEDQIWGTASSGDKQNGEKLPTFKLQKLESKPLNADQKIIVFEVVNHPDKPGKTRIDETSNGEVPSYAAFPQRPQEDAKVGSKSNPVYKDIEFVLEFSFSSKHQKDIEAALWAWETFGGIGARTRRGFGAIRCISIDSKPVPLVSAKDVSKKIEADLIAHTQPENPSVDMPQSMPFLAPDSDFIVTHSRSNRIVKTHEVWRDLIEELRLFRQERVKVDDDGQMKFDKHGFSTWPAPNAVRKLKTGHIKSGRPFVEREFPRGQFGLPIEFHFPQDGLNDFSLTGYQKDNENDENKSYSRMASRLIMRPFACQRGAVGLAIVLEGPKVPPGGVWLIEHGKEGTQIDSLLKEKVSVETQSAADIPPLAGRSDVLKVFLSRLKELK